MPTNDIPIEESDMENGNTIGATFVSKFFFVYGPYGFSLASLLVIWISIVNPILDRSQADFDKFQRAMDTIQNTTTVQAENQRSMERMLILQEQILRKVEALK